MSAVIEGDLIAAPSSAEMSSWKSRIAALEASDPERAFNIPDANGKKIIDRKSHESN